MGRREQEEIKGAARFCRKKLKVPLINIFPAADNYQNPAVLHLKILKMNREVRDY